MAESGTGDDNSLRILPLKALHQAAGARFGPFAGWEMPIQYPLGVMKEHLHCREQAGLFDISHMKLFRVSGRGAAAFLSHLCPIDADAMATGKSRLTFFLDEQAGILDDLIVTRIGDDRFIVVANAGKAMADEAHLRRHAGAFQVSLEPLERVFLALQGPLAEAALERAGIDGSHLAFMSGSEDLDGRFLTRSGYTGEDGFEIALPVREAIALAERLLADPTVAWIGLAARDSLRLEAGLCLHGQDITPETSPAEAGLMWAITKPVRTKGAFLGAPALADQVAAGPSRRRVGLTPEGRQPVRAGAELFDTDGNGIGSVTSGGFGPTAGHPVAMGYVAIPLSAPGSNVFAEVRGTRVPMTVTTLPFVPSRTRKG